MVTSSTPPEIKPEEERVVNFQPDIDADTDTRDRWIDAHSVTCALCGGLADERETIKLYDQDTELEGEAHLDCWDDHTSPNPVFLSRERCSVERTTRHQTTDYH